MFNWIGNYFSSENTIKIFESWIEWQKIQPKSHYVESTLSTYITPKPGHKNPYIKYCFGDFENIYYMPEHINEMAYFTLLLNTYDRCKGYLRSIVKGDLTGIDLLRRVIKAKNSDELYNHDFTIYDYNCSILHGHTIAYHSLSTLIMYLVSNYMHYKSYNSDHFPHIDIELCKTAYFNKIFGDVMFISSNKDLPKSNTIIIKKEIKNDITRTCNSWHGQHINSSVNKCSHCKRVCDSYWSKHKLCLNCHLYEVCSVCAGEKFSVGVDGYPLCIIHKNG